MVKLQRLFQRKRGGTAFVLSGGGNLGAIQVGMLRALVEARIRPDLVLGCSVGAMNGAAFAQEPNLVGPGRKARYLDLTRTTEANAVRGQRDPAEWANNGSGQEQGEQSGTVLHGRSRIARARPRRA